MANRNHIRRIHKAKQKRKEKMRAIEVTVVALPEDIKLYRDKYFWKREGYKMVKINKTIVKDIRYGNLVTIVTKRLL